MKRKSLINRILQNVRKPEGFFGRMILWGMNQGHASLAHWGMSCMEWHQGWNVLDIGCGGGANLAQILKYCPQGKAFGIDISPESVAFARKRNRRQLGTRCFVEQGVSINFHIPITVLMWSPLLRPFTSGVTYSILLLKWHVS
jgi:SAM-dependent methyltransferase